MDEDKVLANKDHDLLVRVDAKMDTISEAIQKLTQTLDDRGKAIDELKTYTLLHEKETDTMWEKHDAVAVRVTNLETKIAVHDVQIDEVKKTSIVLWIEKNPKLFLTLLALFFLILDFHDIIVPYLFGLVGYKLPTP